MRALEEEHGAVGVGGWVQVEPRGPWGRAIGAALASRFGIGNPRSWSPPSPGQGRMDVDTFPLGSWPAERLRALGGWDERFLRNQDFELNYRLRRAGGRLVFDPAIRSVVSPTRVTSGPRSSVLGLRSFQGADRRDLAPIPSAAPAGPGRARRNRNRRCPSLEGGAVGPPGARGLRARPRWSDRQVPNRLENGCRAGDDPCSLGNGTGSWARRDRPALGSTHDRLTSLTAHRSVVDDWRGGSRGPDPMN